MGKGLAIFGLLLIIVGILPIILPLVGMGQYVMYFSLATYVPSISYSIELAGYVFTELMLILIGVGVLLLLIGAFK